MSTIELDVQGMSCGGCAKHVTQSLRALPGAGSVDVDLAAGRVRLSGELGHGSEAAIAALAAAGYPAQLTTSPTATTLPKPKGCQSSNGGCCCG
jgi:copper chaperone CopZ